MMGFVKARRTGKQDESNTGEALTFFSGGCRWPLRPTAFPQTVIPQPVLLRVGQEAKGLFGCAYGSHTGP